MLCSFTVFKLVLLWIRVWWSEWNSLNLTEEYDTVVHLHCNSLLNYGLLTFISLSIPPERTWSLVSLNETAVTCRWPQMKKGKKSRWLPNKMKSMIIIIGKFSIDHNMISILLIKSFREIYFLCLNSFILINLSYMRPRLIHGTLIQSETN